MINIERIFAKKITTIAKDGTINNFDETLENRYYLLDEVGNAINQDEAVFLHSEGPLPTWDAILTIPDYPSLEQEKIMMMILKSFHDMQSFNTISNYGEYPFKGSMPDPNDFFPVFGMYKQLAWDQSQFFAIPKSMEENHIVESDVTNSFINEQIPLLLNNHFIVGTSSPKTMDFSLYLPEETSFYQRSFLYFELPDLDEYVTKLYAKFYNQILNIPINNGLYEQINFETTPGSVPSLRRYCRR